MLWTYGIIYYRSSDEDEICLRMEAENWFDAEREAIFHCPEGYKVYGIFFKNMGMNREILEPSTLEDYPIVFEEWIKENK